MRVGDDVKRRLLIVGIVLLVIGVFAVAVAPESLDLLADAVGLSSTTSHLTNLVQPTLVTVTGSNQNYVSASLRKGLIVVGNFTVLSGGTASIIALDDSGFRKYARGESAPLVFFTPPLRNGTFTFKVEHNDTYYFVVTGNGEKRSTVALSLNLEEEVRTPTPFSRFGGPGLIVFGVILSGLGVWKDRKSVV